MRLLITLLVLACAADAFAAATPEALGVDPSHLGPRRQLRGNSCLCGCLVGNGFGGCAVCKPAPNGACVQSGGTIGFVDASQPPAPAAVLDYPTYQGQPVDYCVDWETNCGAPAADYFCRLQGYRGATAFEEVQIKNTNTILPKTGRFCDGRARYCSSFRYIGCY